MRAGLLLALEEDRPIHADDGSLKFNAEGIDEEMDHNVVFVSQGLADTRQGELHGGLADSWFSLDPEKSARIRKS